VFRRNVKGRRVWVIVFNKIGNLVEFVSIEEFDSER
jgi:hypothetical protein